MRTAIFLIPGAIFGAGLAISGMANPAKVKGFLDIAGDWDPSLMLVMGGGLAAFALWNRLLSGHAKPRLCDPASGRTQDKIDSRLIGGAVLFGIGWGLAGFCPGPAIAGLGALRSEALVFVPAMVIGMWLAQRLFAADRTA